MMEPSSDNPDNSQLQPQSQLEHLLTVPPVITPQNNDETYMNPQLYQLVIAKKWKDAQEFLSAEDVSIEEKIDALSYRDEDNGHTPLVRAILKNKATSPMPISLLKSMIRIGGLHVLQLKNYSDWNVLHWAAYSNHVTIEVFKLVVQKSNLSMIHAKNNYNNTPLDILLDKRNATAIRKIQSIITREQQLSNSNANICKTLSWARHLPKSDQLVLFQNSYFRNMLNSIFISPQYLFVAMVDLYVQLAVVLVFSVLLRISASQSAFPVLVSLIILLTGFGWFVIRKTTQLMTSYLKTFFVEPSNVIDIVQFVLLAGSIVIVYFRNINEGGWINVELPRIDRLVLTSATCISWLKLLFVIGNLYYPVAVFVAAAITIIGNIIPFLITTAVLIMMISHMYLMWSLGYDSICDESFSNNSEEQWTCDFRTTYAQTFALFFSLENQIEVSHSVIAYINNFIIKVLMLNVLIAVISNYYMIAIEKGNNTFWKNRLQFITECQGLFALLCFWNWCRGDMDRSDIDIDYEGRNFDDCSRAEIDEDTRVSWDNQVDKDRKDLSKNEKIDTLSICTETSQVNKASGERISFGKFNKYLYRKILRTEDKQRFFSWWYDQWRNGPKSPPCIWTRLRYFFGRASLSEIMFPAKEFENIVMGIQYNKKGRGIKLIFARTLSYVLSGTNIVLVAVSFILGLCSFGLCWHPKMKKNLFYVETVEMNLNADKTDQLKKEFLNNLEVYDRNQEKKIENIMRKQEEKERKQFDKVSKKHKEFTKKFDEHENRFDKIDKNLAEIKIMIAAITGK